MAQGNDVLGVGLALTRFVAVLVALLGLFALTAGSAGTLFSCSPANFADAGILAREAPPFAIAGLLWLGWQ